MKIKITLIFGALVQMALSCSSIAYSQGDSVENKEKKQFTFSWQFQNSDAMRPRGVLSDFFPNPLIHSSYWTVSYNCY